MTWHGFDRNRLDGEEMIIDNLSMFAVMLFPVLIVSTSFLNIQLEGNFVEVNLALLHFRTPLGLGLGLR